MKKPWVSISGLWILLGGGNACTYVDYWEVSSLSGPEKSYAQIFLVPPYRRSPLSRGGVPQVVSQIVTEASATVENATHSQLAGSLLLCTAGLVNPPRDHENVISIEESYVGL